ncbi:RpiB/LacA/LacB family sugar-phosphate isomerase [Candidatus Uhrbacteria bacterium]|nr:RpiB/LacA/LacB family sugar-phosphate isomerase [Candidatus Uhrbacteria bacterium]
MEQTRIYLGADHAGWELKEAIKEHLATEHYEVVDLGNAHLVPDDDYPDFARPTALRAATDAGSKGIVICGSGQGSCMAANKVAGVRAGIGYTKDAARIMREDNDANVLCLAGRVLSKEEAIAIVTMFLQTPFSNAPRHARRIAKMV